MISKRFTARASRVLAGRFEVYDHVLGGIARIDGRLAYFDTLAEAKRVRSALAMNDTVIVS